jgi:diguanylate cyclase (GGDEF)-like protein
MYDHHVLVSVASEPLAAGCREIASQLGYNAHEATSAAAVDGAPVAHSAHAEDALDRAVLEASQQFRVAMCVGYVRADGCEHVGAHVRTAAARTWLEPPDIAVLRAIAESGAPLILPDLEASPVARQLIVGSSAALRGFASMPMKLHSFGGTGMLCLLDTQPLTLDAGDLDAFGTLANSLGEHIDRPGAEEGTQSAPFRVRSAELETLERLAVTDPLTGLANRRGGEQNIASEISRAKRQQSPLSCILLDIDRFKAVNDTFGHQAGDHLLRETSALLRRALRAYDILVRWGGEEFLIVLPGVDFEQARRLAERVREEVHMLETNGLGRITVSAGVSTLDTDYDFEAMLSHADRQLYRAKASGRNRVA